MDHYPKGSKQKTVEFDRLVSPPSSIGGITLLCAVFHFHIPHATLPCAVFHFHIPHVTLLCVLLGFHTYVIFMMMMMMRMMMMMMNKC